VTNDPSPADHPGIVAPPPLLYAVGVLVVLLLRWIRPWPILPPHLVPWVGLGLIALGLALGIPGRIGLARARTSVNPRKPTTAIVTSGTYRFTRNPLYVGLAIVFVGLTLAFDTAWGFVVLVPILVVMHFGVILREERYLEAKFGDEYRQYRGRVRRYL
jgi:protein-S-isoprenylcysteine O-methyltransferase Ste14